MIKIENGNVTLSGNFYELTDEIVSLAVYVRKIAIDGAMERADNAKGISREEVISGIDAIRSDLQNILYFIFSEDFVEEMEEFVRMENEKHKEIEDKKIVSLADIIQKMHDEHEEEGK